MIRRLWLGITWPSAVLTLLFGTWMGILYGSLPIWFVIKLLFVSGLFLYHLSLHRIYQQQARFEFHYTSQQLRIWNEVATVFLFAIVFLVVVKDLLSLVWGLVGLAAITIALLIAIRLYKGVRKGR
jgi:putative membrane protein